MVRTKLGRYINGLNVRVKGPATVLARRGSDGLELEPKGLVWTGLGGTKKQKRPPVSLCCYFSGTRGSGETEKRGESGLVDLATAYCTPSKQPK